MSVNLGVRAKFLIVTVMIVVAVDLAAGVYLQWKLRAAEDQRVEDELSRNAQTVAELVEWGFVHGSVALSSESIDPIADRLGETMAVRVTIIGADGVVLGDSSLGLAEVSQVANHGDRPEVLEAGPEACGLARRYSDTLGTEMLYCAIALEVPGDGAGPAFVRVATRLEALDDSFAQMRLILVFGGLLSLAMAIGAGLVASRVMYGKFRELVESTRAVADGDKERRSSVKGGDEFGGMAGSLTRVSEELERTVKQLARERDLFEAVIHSMDEAVLAIDKKRRIIALNRSAREMLSITTEVSGRLLLEAVRIPQLSEALDHALRGESRSIDIELESAGSLRQLMVRATPQGESGGAVLVMHDVTEIRRLETVRRDFVANVSHELRTPVSIIQANAETLLLGAIDEPAAARRFLDAVSRNAERLGQLISDLLDISRIEAGKYKMELDALSLTAVARSVSRSVSESCRRREVVFGVDIAPELQVHGDARALEQVLVNLVENAVKYGPEGGVVDLVAVEQDTAVRIEVRDEGPGIGPDHRSRVFERFYRVDPGRSRHMGGTGLGLAIVKNLTEAMGGDVGVDPREPRGSCFWVRLRKVSPKAPEADAP
ncbi:Alkaline phosphatase synthesis sensor protein PhoR [Enhygromyxa salina]|uniref:histidine kinase n=1 Tax=Enhygromyxa salina TaxID=215803 RepID=A0A2S9YLE3_9BACT|nr:ATP-binding protein [Enhygromyxa salina]PRQ05872.1 Alkaline phosphatase synthesis sensor protein PhoR [Enhygromyxa salina]